MKFKFLMKFTFDKKFKFDKFPEILKCHERYNQLVDKAYEMEEKYDNGECSKDEWRKALDIANEYYIGEYAQAVFNEFYGKGLYIKDWRTKKITKFDDYFKAPFDDISSADRKGLTFIVENKYGLKLTKDFYE